MHLCPQPFPHVSDLLASSDKSFHFFHGISMSGGISASILKKFPFIISHDEDDGSLNGSEKVFKLFVRAVGYKLVQMNLMIIFYSCLGTCPVKKLHWRLRLVPVDFQVFLKTGFFLLVF